MHSLCKEEQALRDVSLQLHQEHSGESKWHSFWRWNYCSIIMKPLLAPEVDLAAAVRVSSVEAVPVGTLDTTQLMHGHARSCSPVYCVHGAIEQRPCCHVNVSCHAVHVTKESALFDDLECAGSRNVSRRRRTAASAVNNHASAQTHGKDYQSSLPVATFRAWSTIAPLFRQPW